ncbi:MAG: TetR/AcrR family transcriptional regulator [Ruminococcus sp.]|nr:TetR/AcrR family transcriptional regulator [Ruminococcus sp.]
MDKRPEKTKRAIINAFLLLRAKKPLEKITVKELAELAEINKATFYLHYHDIYELSESLERDVVQNCLWGIAHPEEILRDTRRFIRELSEAFVANEQLIKILFDGSRSSSFISLFEEELRKVILSVYPDYQPTLESQMMTSYLIYGGYYTYFKYCDTGIKPVMDIIGRLSDGVVSNCSDDETVRNA